MDDPNAIRFPCPHCGKSLRTGPEFAGRRVKCPRTTCGQVVTVPTAWTLPGPARAMPDPDSGADHAGAPGAGIRGPSTGPDDLRIVTALDPDPSLPVCCLFAVLFVVPLVLMFGVPWLFSVLDLFEARYLVPGMLAFPLFSGGVALVWRRLYKPVPVVELLPRLLNLDDPGTAFLTGSANRIRMIGTQLHLGGGTRLMREVYEAVERSELREAWAGIGGWPDSWADVLVEELAGLLERDARDPITEGGFGHQDRIRSIGKEVNEFGGIKLMRKVYNKVLARGPYFSQDIWDGVGEWRC